jgi:hypothetical protein
MPLKPLPASERRLKQDGDDGNAGAEASSTSKAEFKAEMRSVGKRKAPYEATERNAPPDPSASQGANGAIAEGDEPVPLKKQKLNGKAMARLKRRAEREAAEKRAGVQPGGAQAAKAAAMSSSHPRSSRHRAAIRVIQKAFWLLGRMVGWASVARSSATVMPRSST